MTLLPLLQAPLAVQIHVATVIPAAVVGAWLLLFEMPGSKRHRRLGRLWMGLMITTSLVSFFIHDFNLLFGLSPIHLLSILTIAGCLAAIRAAMRGDICSHRRYVRGVYIGGIVIAGLLTLIPGRLMNTVVFGSAASSVAALAQ